LNKIRLKRNIFIYLRVNSQYITMKISATFRVITRTALFIFLFIYTATIVVAGESQLLLLKKARKQTLNGKYTEARKNYLRLTELDPANPKYHYELGLNYFYYTDDNKTAAIPYFQNALKYSKKDTLGEIYYALGEAHQLAGNFNEAVESYQHFKRYIKKGKDGDELLKEVNVKIAQCYHGNSFAIASNKTVRIENLGANINSSFADYVPVISEDENIIMFTSRRNNNTGGKIDYNDEKYFEDMFIARKKEGGYTPAEQFSVSDKYVGLIENSPKHDAVVGLSFDEKKLFTYREDKIWVSELGSDGNWKGPMELNNAINIQKGYQPHACLTADGNTIYFSSERKDGKGKLDLYRAKLKSDGNWGEAENLGDIINTAENEDSPYITADGKYLYFSSKGHNSMGGYDIFKAEIIADGTFGKPENLGAPINSGADDIFYLPNKSGSAAYFASSRKDGLGDMDIYKAVFILKPSFTNCELIANKYEKNGHTVAFSFGDTLEPNKAYTLTAQLQLNNLSKQMLYWDVEKDSIAEGERYNVTFTEKGEKEIKLEIIAENTISGAYESFCIAKKVLITDIVTEIQLAGNTVKAEDLKQSTEQISLKNIYFDFDKSNLRQDAQQTMDENIALLKSNPELIIKIAAHTDSRGSSDYNLALSKRRAQQAVDYLVKNGIARKRIVAVVSLGDKEPANACSKDVECSEDQHQQNRRAEFSIIGKSK
jgi:outer membrane protein OmpA-like peptidoglycan-associated protein